MTKDKRRPKASDAAKRAADGGRGTRVDPVIALAAGRKRPSMRPPDVSGDRVTWQFACFDPHGPFDEHIDGPGAAKLLALLGEVEAKSHSELFDQPGNRQSRGATKRIPVDHICADARRRLTDLDIDDVDELWEIREAWAPRVWALRYRHFVSVLWWDPDHKVCPGNR